MNDFVEIRDVGPASEFSLCDASGENEAEISGLIRLFFDSYSRL
jgi:hypothetical protein